MYSVGLARWHQTTDCPIRGARLHCRTSSLQPVSGEVSLVPYTAAHHMHSLLFVASLFEDQPMLVDVSDTIPVKRQLPSAPKRPKLDGEDLSEKQAMQDAKQSTCVTIFTAQGDHIIAGTNKGWLNVIEVSSCRILHSSRLCSGVIIFLRLTASGRDMVSNASDKIVRTIPIPSFAQAGLDMDGIAFEVEHKFQDTINNRPFHHVVFSPTGDYVAASALMNHDIYVWERHNGTLAEFLEGPKEELGVVEVRVPITADPWQGLMASSGIPIVPSWQHVVWSQAASISGRSKYPNGGQH